MYPGLVSWLKSFVMSLDKRVCAQKDNANPPIKISRANFVVIGKVLRLYTTKEITNYLDMKRCNHDDRIINGCFGKKILLPNKNRIIRHDGSDKNQSRKFIPFFFFFFPKSS